MVYVSKEYRRRDVLEGILRDVDALPKDVDKLPQEELVNKLRNVLDEKRRRMGSKIMLTTRNTEVALHADARSDPHQLRHLTEDESLRLLCKSISWSK
ncbi:P-loop containing nucleoside triphosphate hydrolase [Sesbania bispinosa]|nr:P-loop containing nucleoside triphosphate hydrolase [Sesbania bispinosa]